MRGKQNKVRFLDTLMFEVTTRCNMGCAQCGSSCTARGVDLPGEDILRVLSEVKTRFGTEVMVNITGGEPLLHPGLFPVMRKASAMGFDWGMVTNGSLIAEETVERMRDAGMKTVSVSLDGLQENHERLRRAPGAFPRIIEGIRLMKQAGFLDHLQVTFTANRENLDDLEGVWSLCRKLGVDSLRTSCVDPIGRAAEKLAADKSPSGSCGGSDSLLLDKAGLIRWSEEVMRLNDIAGRKMPVVLGCCHYFGDRFSDLNGRLYRPFRCRAGLTIASVLANGDIFACPNIPRRPELICGNIHRDSFTEVWERGFLPYRKRRLQKKCLECPHWEACRGDSFHTLAHEAGRPKFCYMEQFGEKLEELSSPVEKKNPGLISEDSLLLRAESSSRIRGKLPRVFIEGEVLDELERFFHLGGRHPQNLWERQMGLVGIRRENGAVIRYVFPSVTMRIGPDKDRLGKETMRQALRELEACRRCAPEGDQLSFLGFAHSHPGQVPLRYSVGDVRIHAAMQRRFGDYIGMLVEPFSGRIGCYYGEAMQQAELLAF